MSAFKLCMAFHYGEISAHVFSEKIWHWLPFPAYQHIGAFIGLCGGG